MADRVKSKNRDEEIYEAYVRRCQSLGIQAKDIATKEKYFDINRTAGRGSL